LRVPIDRCSGQFDREGGGDVVRDKGTVFGICRVDWREPDFGGGVGGMVNEIVDGIQTFMNQ